MKVRLLKCNECNQEIYSRAHYDCKNCKCHNIMVDGGRYDYEDKKLWTYERYGGKDCTDLKSRIVNIDVTEEELYADWNESKDKYGVYNE